MPSPIIVTATLQDVSASALVGNSFLRFRLRNYAGFAPRVAGTSVIAETQIDAFPNGSGLVTQNLWANNILTPSTTFWTVEAWDLGRIVWSANYIFNANTDLGTAAQLNTPPVPPGFSLVLENNGALNSSQNILNLVNTDNSLLITDLGAGNIQLNSKASGFATSGVGGFWAAGFPMMSLPFLSNGGVTNMTVSANADQVSVFQFSLDSSWTLSRVSCYVGVGAATGLFNFGIYDSSGNKLVDSGGLDGTSGTVIKSNAITPVVLPKGVYYLAMSSHVTSNQVQGVSFSSIPMVNILNAFGSVKNGTAANATVAGVMPATLGTITAAVSGGLNMPAVFFGV